jgi:Zn-finger nucleic acid-binding protein
MGITEKPSDPEEEFFHKDDLEKVQALRRTRNAERAKQAIEQQKALHWMRCPKCGSRLEETHVRDVAVDICVSCRGVWLDCGELEMLLGIGAPLFKRMAAALRADFKYGDPEKP